MCRRRRQGSFLVSHPTTEEYFEGQALIGWLKVLSDRKNEEGYSDQAVAIEAARLAEISKKERFPLTKH